MVARNSRLCVGCATYSFFSQYEKHKYSCFNSFSEKVARPQTVTALWTDFGAAALIVIVGGVDSA
jgi:hypothetical protein